MLPVLLPVVVGFDTGVDPEFDPLPVVFPPSVFVDDGDVGFDALVAVIMTGVLLVTLGAVKIPSVEIVPALVDHVTRVLGLPLIRATNCNFSNEVKVAVLGERVSDPELEFADAVPAFCDREPQPAIRPLRQSASATRTKFSTGF
jgi:hypothetical protein